MFAELTDCARQTTEVPIDVHTAFTSDLIGGNLGSPSGLLLSDDSNFENMR